MESAADIPLHRHPKPHREIARRYRAHWAEREFRRELLVSALLFLASVWVVFLAIRYATERASSAVTDIVLSNTPVFDMDGLFVFGTLSLVACITLILLAHPKRVPFAFHSMAILYFTRAVFVSLTHIGPFPTQTPNSFDLGHVIGSFFFGNDLFFSGHVALPFLMALIFWHDRILRTVFIAWSVFMAVVVLLSHLHYSIDVASAYFITYAVFALSAYLFPRSRAFSLHGDAAAA